MKTRNRVINTYIGILVVTIVGSLAALYILHVAIDMPFEAFASNNYDIDSSR